MVCVTLRVMQSKGEKDLEFNKQYYVSSRLNGRRLGRTEILVSAVCPNHNMLCLFVEDVIPFIGECYHGGHRKKSDFDTSVMSYSGKCYAILWYYFITPFFGVSIMPFVFFSYAILCLMQGYNIPDKGVIPQHSPSLYVIFLD